MSMELTASRKERIERLGYNFIGQPKTNISSCNLCGTNSWVIITHIDRYGYPAPAMTCSICGLTILNPQMTSEAYKHFYTSIYRPLVSAYHGRLIDSTTIQGEQAEYATIMADFIAPLIADSERQYHSLLDIGGSTGIVASHFANKFNLKATVIDPAPAEAEVATKLGINTVVGFVEDWEPNEKFDVVGMFQTIDHLLDVKGTLEKIRKLISSDGLFLMDIVDFRAAYLRNASVEEAVKIDHPYYFTETTIETFLRRIGFEWIRKSYSPDHLHIAYACKPTVADSDALADPKDTAEFLKEIRYIQNVRKVQAL